MVDAAHIPEGFSLGSYSSAILVASVHRGEHEVEMKQFVKLHLAELHSFPAAFLSVSLTEASVEDPSAPSDRRLEAEAAVNKTIEAFMAETGWHPERIKAVAGALLYTNYNLLLRLVMKRIERQMSGATDTSEDHEYTGLESSGSFY